jgi:hypothetical protein
MATPNYLIGRKKYGRPQAMLWSENPGTLQIISAGTPQEQRYFVPTGNEIGSNQSGVTDSALLDQFLILSDDNRSSIDFKNERIEKRERMINGRMRSYHIADKLSISTSWENLPSRGFAGPPNFDQGTGKPALVTSGLTRTSSGAVASMDSTRLQYTTDGGAGGSEILDWYEQHKGSFWVYLSYDKHTNFGDDAESYRQLSKYSQVVEMFISDFSYSVVKRGSSNFDFWDIQVSLEEV